MHAYAHTLTQYFYTDYATSVQAEYCCSTTKEEGKHPANGIKGVDAPCMYTVSVDLTTNQHIDPGMDLVDSSFG